MPSVGLLGAGVLGHGLGALRHGVLGQLTGQQQADGGLDLPGGDGGALVVVSQTRGLTGDALENVADEGVHDAHSLGGDPGVGVDLLQDLVDVDSIALLPGSPPLLAGLGGFRHSFLGALLGRFHRIRHAFKVCGFLRYTLTAGQSILNDLPMQISLRCCSHRIGWFFWTKLSMRWYKVTV